MSTFESYEQYPTLLSLPELKKLEGKRSIVKTGLFIRSFSKFDISKNEFEFDGVLWFEFDPHEISLDSLAQSTIANGEIIRISKPFTSQYNNKTRARFEISAKFKPPLQHRRFPIDDHRLAIELINHTDEAQKIIFESSPESFSLNDTIAILGWKFVGTSVQYGFSEERFYAQPEEKHYYQKVVFLLDCMRDDIRHVATILIPLLLLLFLTLFCFSFNIDRLFNKDGISDTHSQTILSVVLFSVSTLMAYRFVIEAMSPDVSYFMLSDYLFFLFLIATMIVFGLIANPNKLSHSQKKLWIFMLYALIVISCIILIW